MEVAYRPPRFASRNGVGMNSAFRISASPGKLREHESALDPYLRLRFIRHDGRCRGAGQTLPHSDAAKNGDK